MSRGLRHLIADATEKRSIATRLRRKRGEVLHRDFPDVDKFPILDLGGTVKHSETNLIRPQSIVAVTLPTESSDINWMTAMQDNACDPPAFALDANFDLVYFNSPIEHLSVHARHCDFPSAVQVVAPSRCLPIELHWFFPRLQFPPQRARAWAVPGWRCGSRRPPPNRPLRMSWRRRR